MHFLVFDQDRKESVPASTECADDGIRCLPQQTDTTVSVRSGDRPSVRARALICEGFCRSTRASATTRLGRRARSTEGVETAITMHIPFRKNRGNPAGFQPQHVPVHFWMRLVTCSTKFAPFDTILAILTPLRNPLCGEMTRLPVRTLSAFSVEASSHLDFFTDA